MLALIASVERKDTISGEREKTEKAGTEEE